ncbi:M20/M25/M40 family metallo-hydrolase [Membranicola marinus]|uniref:M20/M25/M40 family metallo-hydrolase n=1 Tax=Membranihabitans marinus TaxID=1227546 RepID=A0A953HJ86_9BACT|nr:M20/M25/M40 family metallo-hydrolase [Membranihabitans marinus]MBY5956874.1 M20/M25/M40 family metallo-hydrolase [Membranihabitans marinus]
MKELSLYKTLLIACLTLSSQIQAQENITVPELYGHIEYLTQKKLKGRTPGGRLNKKVIRYLRTDLKKSGVKHFNHGYFQPFYVQMRSEKEESPGPTVQTWNIMGYIPGHDTDSKNEYIVLGAHYDHLGMGGPSSKAPTKSGLHAGADDNASGTAALLEIAEKLSANRELLDRSIIIVAFGAEEQGLKGSSYFIDHPPVPKEQIKLMINMDMVGRLNDQKHIYMGGAGTFPNGMELMKKTGNAQGLSPIVHAGEVGGSDHVSFYRQKISVLGLHTGAHPQYHTPEDTIELINFAGTQKVAEYIYQVILKLASKDQELRFIDQG